MTMVGPANHLRLRSAPMHRPTRPGSNAEIDFTGEKRSNATNATNASTPDPDARPYRKSPGTGAMRCFIGHALMENRAGVIVQGDLTQVFQRRYLINSMNTISAPTARNRV